jgi:hypothetical protein
MALLHRRQEHRQSTLMILAPTPSSPATEAVVASRRSDSDAFVVRLNWGQIKRNEARFPF